MNQVNNVLMLDVLGETGGVEGRRGGRRRPKLPEQTLWGPQLRQEVRRTPSVVVLRWCLDG